LAQLIVSTMSLALNYWQITSNKPKTVLLNECGIWSAYLDGGTYRSRTFDRYLHINTLPKRPKWQKVVQTGHFVLANCPENSAAKAVEYFG
jgi:two-component system sensor histidine kinase ChiS